MTPPKSQDQWFASVLRDSEEFNFWGHEPAGSGAGVRATGTEARRCLLAAGTAPVTHAQERVCCVTEHALQSGEHVCCVKEHVLQSAWQAAQVSSGCQGPASPPGGSTWAQPSSVFTAGSSHGAPHTLRTRRRSHSEGRAAPSPRPQTR